MRFLSKCLPAILLSLLSSSAFANWTYLVSKAEHKKIFREVVGSKVTFEYRRGYFNSAAFELPGTNRQFDEFVNLLVDAGFTPERAEHIAGDLEAGLATGAGMEINRPNTMREVQERILDDLYRSFDTL